MSDGVGMMTDIRGASDASDAPGLCTRKSGVLAVVGQAKKVAETGVHASRAAGDESSTGTITGSGMRAAPSLPPAPSEDEKVDTC